MRPVLTLSTFAFLVAAAACGGAAGAPAPVAAHPSAPDPLCPVDVPGTSASVEDTDTGAALVFVTTGDADEVRRRVAALAGAHNDHHGAMGPLPTGDAGDGEAAHDHHGHRGHHGHTADDAGARGHGGHGGAHHGPAGMIGVHARAIAEDIPGGARLVLVAAPGDVPALQDEVRMHARHLASGTCAMGDH